MKLSIFFVVLVVFVDLGNGAMKDKFNIKKSSHLKVKTAVPFPGAIPLLPGGGLNIAQWWRENHIGFSYVSWRNQVNLANMRGIVGGGAAGVVAGLTQNVNDHALGNAAAINGAHLGIAIPINNALQVINAADAVPGSDPPGFAINHASNLGGDIMEYKNRVMAVDMRWTFADTLDQIDLMRMNHNIHNLVTAGGGAYNDVRTIVNLSGGFYFRTNAGQYQFRFSGMIIEGQDARGDTLLVRTAFHGTWKENINTCILRCMMLLV